MCGRVPIQQTERFDNVNFPMGPLFRKQFVSILSRFEQLPILTSYQQSIGIKIDY